MATTTAPMTPAQLKKLDANKRAREKAAREKRAAISAEDTFDLPTDDDVVNEPTPLEAGDFRLGSAQNPDPDPDPDALIDWAAESEVQMLPSAKPKATKPAKTLKSPKRAKEMPAAKPKAAKPAKTSAPKKGKKMSMLSAAVKVLNGIRGSLSVREITERMAERGLWASPNGQTPHQTLSTAVQREINTKGSDSRFKRTAPGQFAKT